MNPWLIHIGYRKCGSTWMQKRLFPAMPGIDFLGKRYDQPGLDWLKQVRDALAINHCFDFSPDEVRALIARHAAPRDGCLRVLSYEGLSGETWRRAIDSKRNADRIQQTFPGAKILIVIRRQVAHLESLYKQYLLTGGVLPIARFLTSRDHHLQFDIDCLLYDRLAGYYIQLFGRENVEVLPFELLSASPQSFADAVCRFSGQPPLRLGKAECEYVRRGYTARQCALVRRVNVFCESTFSPVGFYRKPNFTNRSKLGPLNPYPWVDALASLADRMLGPSELLASGDRRRLADHFRASNEALATIYPILSEYGYAGAPRGATETAPSNR